MAITSYEIFSLKECSKFTNVIIKVFQNKLPSFLVIGPPRTGTTWLYNVLCKANNVFVPSRKQIHYFDKNYELGLDWYSLSFKDSSTDDVIGECTPDYISEKKYIKRISKDLPNVKLIMIHRDPVERAFSHYRIRYREGYYGNKSFNEVFLNDKLLLNNSLYYTHLKNLLAFFKPSQILIIDYNSIKHDPISSLKHFFNFIQRGSCSNEIIFEQFSKSMGKSRFIILDRIMVVVSLCISNILNNFLNTLLYNKLRNIYRYIRAINTCSEHISMELNKRVKNFFLMIV